MNKFGDLASLRAAKESKAPASEEPAAVATPAPEVTPEPKVRQKRPRKAAAEPAVPASEPAPAAVQAPEPQAEAAPVPVGPEAAEEPQLGEMVRMLGGRVPDSIFREFTMAKIEAERKLRVRKVTTEEGLEAIVRLLRDPEVQERWLREVLTVRQTRR